MDTDAVWVATGQEAGATRATNSLYRVKTSKAVAGGGEAIEVGCGVRFGTKASKVSITKVICEEEDDVWEAARLHGQSIQKTPRSG